MPRLSALLALFALTACQDSAPAPEQPAAPAVTSPIAVREGKVPSADGVPIAYAVEGEGDVAMILIHGWSCDRTYWRRQLEPLTARYKVVSLDLAGHGASGLERAEWALPAFGGDVAAVVGALGLERVVLVGHSMGAPVALEAVPLLDAEVLGVVAVDSLHDVDQKPDPERWRGVVESYDSDFAGTCSGFVRSMFLDTADPELVESTTTDMCAAPSEIATALMRAFGDYDTAAAMSRAGVPVRAINAERYPTDLEGNREHGDFELEVMDGVGHFPMLEAPEAFNRLLLEAVAELTAR